MRRALLAFAVTGALLTCTLASRTAFAEAPSAEQRKQASEAYTRGVEAHKRGDMKKAAAEFAQADALAPNAVALQAALDAAIDADDAALGGELIERSEREAQTGTIAASVAAAKKKFAGRAGRVRVGCPLGSRCLAKLDDRFIDVDRIVWATAGQHTVIVQVNDESSTQLVDVSPDRIVDVSPAKRQPPPPVPPTDPPRKVEPPPTDRPAQRDVGRNGLPPIIFYAGVGATLLLGGALTGMAIATKDRHDDFAAKGCDQAEFDGCKSLQSQGRGFQYATNALIPLTAVVGVATIVIGVAFTDWKGPTIAAVPGGGVATIDRRF